MFRRFGSCGAYLRALPRSSHSRWPGPSCTWRRPPSGTSTECPTRSATTGQIPAELNRHAAHRGPPKATPALAAGGAPAPRPAGRRSTKRPAPSSRVAGWDARVRAHATHMRERAPGGRDVNDQDRRRVRSRRVAVDRRYRGSGHANVAEGGNDKVHRTTDDEVAIDHES